LEKNN